MQKIRTLIVNAENLLKNASNFFVAIPRRTKTIGIGLLAFLAVMYVGAVSPPINFPSESTIMIEEGSTLTEISQQLKEEKIIRSSFLFKTVTILFGGNSGVLAGDYYFHNRTNMFSVARRALAGEFGLVPIRVTVPEGATAASMADLFEERFDLFDTEHFLKLAESKEGYLFPDTYFFLPNVREKEMLKVLEENFENKIKEIDEELSSFGKPLEEVVIMASILEKEARTVETRRTIAGILWKRIELGMPLQVDAVFVYINGKNTFELTQEDLEIDSPYNTYKYKGLPVGPIANPGLDALRATVTPIESDYLFYLSDLEGNMHYAVTFDRHKENKFRYLR